MKNKTRLATMLLAALISAFLLTGCGNSKISSEESGKIFYNVAVHQDDAKLKEILGDNSSDFDALVSEQVDEAKKNAREMFSSSSINLSDEEANNFVDALLNSMRKQECKNVTVNSETDESVEVTLEVTCVDLIPLCNEVSKELQDDLKQKMLSSNRSSTSYKEIQDQFMKEYFKTVTERLNNYGVGEKTKTMTYTFDKKEYSKGFMSKTEIWIPKDTNDFGKKLGTITLGQ